MQRSTVTTRWILSLVGCGALWLAAGAGVASADVVSASPDVTTQLASVPFHDEDVAVDNQTGLVAAEDLGPVPSQSDVVAYDSLENGDRLLAFDTSVALPGGLTVQPGDVVRYDRARYTLEFDARASGVPEGSMTDAVSKPSASVLLLSFDTTVTLPGISHSVTAADEDLVAFVRGSFSVLFDGSLEGVPPELDLDAAHVRDLTGSFLFSFDGSGRVGGIDFADEDVLEFLPTGRWRLAFDASQQHAGWAPADLDALHVVPEPGGLLPLSALLVLGLLRTLRREAGGQAARSRFETRAGWRYSPLTMHSRLPLLALLLCCLAGTALAVDGVRELSQACAKNTGCLAGDPAGFPVTIAEAGSYRLTSNLYSGGTATTVLEVTASRVTVDLNGFEIAACESESCPATGAEGYGVKAGGRTEVSVRNGTIRNMQRQGVHTGSRGHVESIRSVLNGGGGHPGIQVGTSSRVVGNVVSGSSNAGISAGRTSTVSDNRVEGSGNWGIFTGEGSVVTGNTAYDNALGGIWVGTGSTVRGNSAYSNAQTGIKAARGCTVRENAVADNGGVGLELSALSGYGENVLANNDSDITGGGPLGTNLCDGVSCNAPPRRRFYLTTETVNGAGPDEPAVCADGFHFASLWEIWDLSQLEYDTRLGRTDEDSGSGPPLSMGWVRTGWRANGLSIPGRGNCWAWSNASEGQSGSAAQPSFDWAGVLITTTGTVPPWQGIDHSCSDPAPVWCVQD